MSNVLDIKSVYDISDLRRANKRAGLHWFSKGALRWFNTRFSADVWRAEDGSGVYFVTSERCSERHDRLYSVRFMNLDGAVSTVGEFQQYASLSGAKGAAARFARGG